MQGPDDSYIVHFNDDAAGDDTEIEQWKLQAV
jgi:hypothetical protein